MLQQIKAQSQERISKSTVASETVQNLDIDQKQRAAAALQQLEQMLDNTFQTEDNMHSSGLKAQHAQNLFEQVAAGSGPVLTSEALARLESAISRVHVAQQTSQIPLRHLTRLQKVCLKSLVHAAEEDFGIFENASGLQPQALAALVHIAENGITAARLLLRIITLNREEKVLYSEELLADTLGLLKTLAEKVIVPVVEARSSSDLGKCISYDEKSRMTLGAIAQRTGRCLKLLSDLIISSEISEMSITTIDYLCTMLIFVGNASSEKESILGINKFENLRRSAMDTLARVFLRSPSLRDSILDEILSSLEKLPVARQTARHYKIVDGKPIQLVSALIMNLIQTTATIVPNKGGRAKFQHDRSDSDEDVTNSSTETSPTRRKSAGRPKLQASTKQYHKALSGPEGLTAYVAPLLDSVTKNAKYVTHYLVTRALKSSKTSDEPYRNLLDIFTEDFINVLGHADWPAAELVLRELLLRLIGITDNDKSPAPAKNMALDLMGVMGSGIIQLRLHLEHLVQGSTAESDEQTTRIANLAKGSLEGRTADSELISLTGPFRNVTEYLDYRGTDDVSLSSARNYYLLQWSQKACTRPNSTPIPGDEDQKKAGSDHAPSGLVEWLLNTVKEPASANTG